MNGRGTVLSAPNGRMTARRANCASGVASIHAKFVISHLNCKSGGAITSAQTSDANRNPRVAHAL